MAPSSVISPLSLRCVSSVQFVARLELVGSHRRIDLSSLTSCPKIATLLAHKFDQFAFVLHFCLATYLTELIIARQPSDSLAAAHNSARCESRMSHQCHSNEVSNLVCIIRLLIGTQTHAQTAALKSQIRADVFVVHSDQLSAESSQVDRMSRVVPQDSDRNRGGE